jgi:hypothetical protein
MRSIMIPAALATSVMAAAPSFALVPAGNAAVKAHSSGVTPAKYYYHRHYRHYRGGWVPYRYRGFADPGYAYHGNINGCAVDLGYGRWESCDRGR